MCFELLEQLKNEDENEFLGKIVKALKILSGDDDELESIAGDSVVALGCLYYLHKSPCPSEAEKKIWRDNLS